MSNATIASKILHKGNGELLPNSDEWARIHAFDVPRSDFNMWKWASMKSGKKMRQLMQDGMRQMVRMEAVHRANSNRDIPPDIAAWLDDKRMPLKGETCRWD